MTTSKIHSKRTAFVKGVAKGLAAPLAIYSGSEMPAHARPMKFQHLQRQPVSGVGDNWRHVGQLLKAAAAKHRSGGG